jgi:ATP-dependent protease HslVU (ClpYQ) peptidase subunit
MTVIVGWHDSQSAWIGGDSGAFAADTVTIASESKVWRADDSLIGVCGSFRQGEIARESGVGDPYKLRDFMLADYNNRASHPTAHEAEFLIVNTDGVYYLGEDFSVIKCRENYGAVGGGIQVALGVLFALENVSVAPKDRLTMALKASAHHTTMARPPFKVISL